jgi:outer membrane protein OmpA-like peptidoglycan-associated protein
MPAVKPFMVFSTLCSPARLALAGAFAMLAASASASADATSGIDSALFRSSYDTGGVFSLEGARLLPKRDLSFKLLVSYARSPLTLAVPGIGATPGDATDDRVLNYLLTLDMAFGMTLTDRIAIGIDAAAYRTSPGRGYGRRGRYAARGQIVAKSTGLIALRPLSNINQSANPNNEAAFLGDGLAGPLDARFGLKVALLERPQLAVTAIGTVVLPFGDDEMLLGDRNLVFEPRIAVDWRQDRIRATRVVGNVGVRLRQRTVLEGYDTMDGVSTDADAKAFLDVGSELVVGVGGMYEISPRLVAGLEATAFVPLPDALTWGNCRRYNGQRCSALTASDYFAGAKQGDLATQVTLGATWRVSTDVTANVLVGAGVLGARGEDVRITTGIVWAPQPGGGAEPGRNDRDGDGIPDAVDGCSDEAEDKDGFQDEDGCPERDNDRDDITDIADKCPNEAEDKDGFEDDDGCPDDDNDGDGFADKADKCPNEPETVNGFEDDDGCPDVRGTSGPEERADRIDLKGANVVFARAALTAPTRQLLGQVAQLIRTRRLAIRVEVHVPLGTRSTNAGQITAQKRRDKQLTQQRARLIADYLTAQGVPPQLVQAVGLGSDRPLGSSIPTDPVNERVDFIKAQQGGTP